MGKGRGGDENEYFGEKGLPHFNYPYIEKPDRYLLYKLFYTKEKFKIM